MAVKYAKKLQMFNSHVLQTRENFGGQAFSDFELVTGSRLVWALSIKTIDPGASIVVNIKNGFTRDFPFETILNITGNAAGFYKKVLTDTHNLFDVDVTVVGGNATYALGVSISDNALTTRIENAEIAVDLNHILQSNGEYDSVRIGDGVEELEINPDGSINVNIVNTSVVPEIVRPVFNKITSVVDSIRSSIVSHTASLTKQTYLQFISVSGNNIADYELEINSSVIDERNTYFGGPLSEQFEFNAYSENGMLITPGQKIEVFSTHYRSDLGDFSSRIQILEVG